MTMDVLLARPTGRGWATVTLMARLAARLFEGRLSEHIAERRYPALRRATGLLPRVRGRGALLVVAATPGDLVAVSRIRHWLPGHKTIAAWVIDSFWDDRIPSLARNRGHFDHLFITDAELTDRWSHATGTPTTWLPFGCDALTAPRPTGDRHVDLQRVGRQPGAWDDDDAARAEASSKGLVYEGRPPFHDDPAANQTELLNAMSRAKFTLSFSNAVSPAPYTHPAREYLTGRWTDALARGASVAGIPPRCRATSDLLWPEAMVELPGVDRGAGLDAVAEAAAAWTPELAQHNHAQSLRRLDWRLRFDELADTIGFRTSTLDREVQLLRRAREGAS